MTEKEFLKLPKEEQNALVVKTVGWGRGELHRPSKSVLLRPGLRSYGHEQLAWPGKWVNGDGNAFFVMWNALPINDVTDWRFTTAGDSTGHESHSVSRHGGFNSDKPVQCWSGWRKTPNLAVAIALLKAKGIISDV